MASRRGTVSVLPDRGWASQVQREHGEALRAVVGQLDELCDRWPAKQWVIASTAWRMRVPGANRGLGDLTGLISSSEQGSVRLGFQLNDACRAARQQLHDVETSLESLRDPDASLAERARRADLFASSQSGLLAALAEIHGLMPTRDSGVYAAATDQGADRKLADELRDLDERLREMLDVCEEKPGAIDAGLLSDGDRDMDVGAVISNTYRIMKTQVYAEDSPLRADRDVWTAFEEQKDEFIAFYKSARTAVEIYREVLQAYHRAKMTAELVAAPGDLKSLQQDKHVQVAERSGCIEAISDFRGKFSAMLTILR
jgi:hypothetical protein